MMLACRARAVKPTSQVYQGLFAVSPVDLCSVFAMLFDPPSGISVNTELERGQSGGNVHR